MGKFIMLKCVCVEGVKCVEDDVVRERLWEFWKDGCG